MRRADAAFAAAGIACALGVAGVVAAARHTGDAAGSPLTPPGGWRTLLWVALVVAFVAYACGFAIGATRRVQLATAAVVAGVVQLVPLAGPLLLSTDATSYTTYGRAHLPYHLQDGWATPSVYGPLWTFVSEPIARLGNPELGFRVLAAVSALGMVAGAAWLAADAPTALAFVGWNPLLALHAGGGGHNDALMMALVVLALVLARLGRLELAGAAWAASIWIKWVTGIFWLWWVVARWRRGERLGLGGFAAANAVLVAAAFARFGTDWPALFRNGADQARQPSSLGVIGWLGHIGVPHREAAAVAAVALLAVVAGVLLLGRRFGLGATLSALVQGRLNPWYGFWGIGVAGAEEDAVGRVAAVLLSALLLNDVLPR